jgi:hypothetical protein
MTLETFKAPAQLCRYCGTKMPPQPNSRGRPRSFCKARCRRDWHILKERFERERATDEQREQWNYERDWGWYGRRVADKARRSARKRLAAWQLERERILAAPWKEKP